MELRDLHYFRVIARHGHVGRAAAELGLTQPALSKSVARLEAAVGASLFERTPRGVVPTLVGAALLARATQIGAAVSGALREARDLVSGATGHLRVGAGPIAGEHLLPGVCSALLRDSPGLSIQLVLGLNDVLMAALGRGELDLVFGNLPQTGFEGMAFETLSDDELAVFARRGHRLARSRRPGIADVARCRWALPNSAVASRSSLERVLHEHAMPSPDVALESNSTSVLAAAVARSDLLGYFPSGALMASGAARGLALLDVKELRVRRRLCIIYREGAYLPPAAERLKAALRAAATAASDTGIVTRP